MLMLSNGPYFQRAQSPFLESLKVFYGPLTAEGYSNG
mgnify:FL=1